VGENAKGRDCFDKRFLERNSSHWRSRSEVTLRPQTGHLQKVPVKISYPRLLSWDGMMAARALDQRLSLTQATASAGSPPKCAQNSSRALVFGKGASGTATPRNLHSGAQPSAGVKTNSRSAGMVARTRALFAR
jgi:hypothetical protein